MKKLKRLHQNTELYIKIAIPIIMTIIIPSVVILLNEILIKKSILHY